MHSNQNKSHKKIYLFIIAIIISTAISIITSFNPVKASTSLIKNMTVEDHLRSNEYVVAMSMCMKEWGLRDGNLPLDNGARLQQKNVDIWHWFSKNWKADLFSTSGEGSPAIGYMLAGSDINNDKSKIQCGDDTSNNWIQDALRIWGGSTPLDPTVAVCAWGLIRQEASATDCVASKNLPPPREELKGNGRRGFDVQLFRNWIKENVYGGAEVSQDSGTDYLLNRKAFFAGCLGTSNPAPYTGSDKGDLYYGGLKYVDDTGKLQLYDYYGTRNKNDTVEYYVYEQNNGTDKNNSNFYNGGSKCSELLNNINNDTSVNDYITAIKTNVDNGIIEKPSTSTTTAAKTKCAIPGIGWIICPVVNFLGYLTDGSWNILTGFLNTNTKIVEQSSDNAAYTAWSSVRNIANIVFVIVFLIIIFSQITSFGISNYGIKKMLPRLIIAVILVNLSFYICQIAVDISNILGYSIKGFLDNLNTAPIPSFMGGDATGKGGWGIVGGILGFGATGLIAWAAIATLIPVLIGAVVAVVMILFILIARQAIIVLLVVLSPLAFVAFILPGTQKLFEKWQKTLTSMLLLFPIVALVMGGSGLAGSILTSSAAETSSVTSLQQIAAAAVAILPLFIIPGLLKKSLDGIGSLGTKLSALGDKASSGAKGKVANSKYMQYKKQQLGIKRGLISGGAYEGGGINGLRSRMNKTLNEKLPGKYGQIRASSGASLAKEQEEKNVGMSEALLRRGTQPEMIVNASKQYKEALEKDDVVKARAALRILGTSGAPGLRNAHKISQDHEEDLYEKSEASWHDEVRDANGVVTQPGSWKTTDGKEFVPQGKAFNAIRKDVAAMGKKSQDNAFTKWSYTSGKKMSQIERDTSTYSGLNALEMAGQDTKVLERATETLSGDKLKEGLSTEGITIAKFQADTVLTNPGAVAMLDSPDKIKIFEDAAGRNTPTPSNSNPSNNSSQNGPQGPTPTPGGGNGPSTSPF